MRERAVALGRERSLLGIFTRAESARLGVLLMNAGLVHRVGPNRLNVHLARRLAARGISSLRVDLSGLGDSPPRRDRRSLEEAHLADLGEALDAFREQEGIERFVLAGVCSGADLSLSMAARDPRVVGAVLIDSFAYSTPLYEAVGYGRRALSLASWRDLASGESDLPRRVARRLGLQPAEGTVTRGDVPAWVMPSRAAIVAEVEAALARSTELLFVYSGGPALYNALTHFAGEFLRLRRSGRLRTLVFPEADHTFTLSLYQAELLAAIERWIDERGLV